MHTETKSPTPEALPPPLPGIAASGNLPATSARFTAALIRPRWAGLESEPFGFHTSGCTHRGPTIKVPVDRYALGLHMG